MYVGNLLRGNYVMAADRVIKSVLDDTFVNQSPRGNCSKERLPQINERNIVDGCGVTTRIRYRVRVRKCVVGVRIRRFDIKDVLIIYV